MQEIDGDLTELERVYLLEQAAADPEVAELRIHLWEVVGSEEVNNYLKENPAEKQAELLLSRLDTPKRSHNKVIYISGAVAAAAAIVLLILNTGILKDKPSSKDIVKVTPVTNNRGVQFAIPSGDVYTLGSDTAISAAGGNLQVSSKTVSFKPDSKANNQLATLTIPAGADYALVLQDGTHIQVNAASTVKFPMNFSGPTRDIYITGEAYIQAAPNPARPLRVHLPGSLVEVLGTEFNVNTYEAAAKVALVSGKVKVVSSADSTILKPGYMSSITQAGITISEFDEYETLSWRTGRFIFRNARFEDVCKVIPRWFGANIALDNKQTSDKRFSGTIDRYQPLDLQLKGLKATGAIDYHLDADSVIHFKFQ